MGCNVYTCTNASAAQLSIAVMCRVGQDCIYLHRIFGDFPAKNTVYIHHICTALTHPSCVE